MPKLTVFTGLLGTGKSKHATILAEKYNWCLLKVDTMRGTMIPRPQYNNEEMYNMYKVMISVAETWLRIGKDVVLDATFSQKKYHSLLKKLITMIKPELYIIHCFCSEKESIRRLKRRILKKKIIAKDTTPSKYHKHKKTFKLINFHSVFHVSTEGCKKSTFQKIDKYINEKKIFKKN